MRFHLKPADDATLFNAPRTENTHPFWMTQCGRSSATKPMHHTRLQSAVFCIQYVISGSGVINVDGKTYTAGPGDTFLLLQGADHNYYSYNADHWECQWINFTGELAEQLLSIYGLRDTVVFYNADTFAVLCRMQEVAQTVSDPDAYKTETSRLFFELVLLLCDKQPKPLADMQTPDFVRQYLDCHVAQAVQLSDVAAAAHQSIEHIIRTFKAAYGMTPYQYLLESKIRLSCVMLASTDKTVEEIADELGFYDAHHFSARFQKVQGCRPSAFRRKFREEDGI